MPNPITPYFPLPRDPWFDHVTEIGQLKHRVAKLEKKLSAAEQVVAEARPLGDVLSKGAVLIGTTLCVTSALSRAIQAYDQCCNGD